MLIFEQFLGGVRVKLEGRTIGVIQSHGDQFAYFPKGSKAHGEPFDTIEQVKASL